MLALLMVPQTQTLRHTIWQRLRPWLNQWCHRHRLSGIQYGNDQGRGFIDGATDRLSGIQYGNDYGQGLMNDVTDTDFQAYNMAAITAVVLLIVLQTQTFMHTIWQRLRSWLN